MSDRSLIRCPKCGKELGIARPNSKDEKEVYDFVCGDCMENEAAKQIKEAQEVFDEQVKKAQEAFDAAAKNITDDARDAANARRALLNTFNWIERY